jgi:hypothetical protein
MLYQLQSTWENFCDNLSVLDRELAERAASLEKAHAWLHQFNEIWRATLQSAKVLSPTALA